jgi:hypothetical protein
MDITPDALIVRLRWWEKICALHGDLRIRLDHVRGATDDDGFRGWELGLRLAGTRLPGVIAAGYFRKQGQTLFAYLTRNRQPLVIELRDEPWARAIIGVADARATAARINAALTRRDGQ